VGKNQGQALFLSDVRGIFSLRAGKSACPIFLYPAAFHAKLDFSEREGANDYCNRVYTTGGAFPMRLVAGIAAGSVLPCFQNREREYFSATENQSACHLVGNCDVDFPLYDF